MKYLDCIEKTIAIADKAKKFDGNIIHGLLLKANKHLEPIKNALEISEAQALMFSVVFYLHISNRRPGHCEIRKTLKVNPLEYFRHVKELKYLVERSILTITNRYEGDKDYYVDEHIITAMMDNQLKPVPQKPAADVFQFADLVSAVLKKKSNKLLSTFEMYQEFEGLLDRHKEISVVKLIQSNNLPIEDSTVVLALMAHNADNQEILSISEMAEGLFDHIQDRASFRRKYLELETPLYKQGLIENCDNWYLESRYIKFTEDTFQLIFDGKNPLLSSKSSVPKLCRLIKPDEVVAKKMFYNPQTETEIKTLAKVLVIGNAESITAKLNNDGFSAGITALLHGGPGTGKTETIYQLAKGSGRSIFMADIANIKDKYVGESEKRLRSIFSEYKLAVKHAEPMPILVFNECDAILGRRINVDTSVDQMNNTLQNILLQELEDFEGIFFATTNLVGNLDKAFERRFLFKINFKAPELKVRYMQWKSRFTMLDDELLKALANNYSLSGGQIENIARKAKINAIVNGNFKGKEYFEQLCQEELLFNQGREFGKVGYRN